MKSNFEEYILKLRDSVALHIARLCDTTPVSALKSLHNEQIHIDTVRSVIKTLMLNEVEPIRVSSTLIDVLIKLKASSTSDATIADICRLWGDTTFNKAIVTCVNNDRIDLIEDVVSSGLSYEKVLMLRVFQ